MQKPAKTLIFSAVALIAAVCLMVGVGLAWFSNNSTPKVDPFDVAVKGKDTTVSLAIIRDKGLLADGSRGETAVDIKNLTFSDAQYGETFTFALELTASRTTARKITVSLDNVSASCFSYKKADSADYYTNYSAFYACRTLTGGLVTEGAVYNLAPASVAAGDVGKIKSTTAVLVNGAVWTPAAEAMTATVTFSLTYGNWIGMDESEMGAVLPSGTMSIGKLSIGSVTV